MKLRAAILATCLPCMSATALADTPAPSFAAGFDMLNALISGESSTQPSWRTRPDADTQNHRSQQPVAQKMLGHGWVIPASDGDPASFIPFGQISPIDEEADFTSLPPADLKADIATLIEFISTLERANNVDAFKQSWNNSGASTFGPLMLFAAQVHRSGHPALADQLAWALFQAAPSREVVIDAALNHLGTELYNIATQDLIQSWDWQDYHEKITQLIQRIPRGWDAQPAAAMVAESVSLRLANPTPTTPNLEGIEIDPAALESLTWLTAAPEKDNEAAPAIPPELAAALAELPPEHRARILQSQGYGSRNATIPFPGLWLLNAPEASHPATPTLKLGITAIPAIAALIGDNYPVHFINPSAAGGRGSFMSYSRGNNPMDRAMEAYRSMLRPATRGDIALLLLQHVLPDPNNDFPRADSETIRQIAIDFYRKNQSNDTAQIASSYMTDGSEYQKRQAAAMLAKSDNPAHHTLFESRILEAPFATTHLASVLEYAMARKAESKPFLDRYITKVRSEIGEGTNVENMRELSWELRQPGFINQMLRQIEAIAEGKSPEDSAREIAAGPASEANTAIQALLQSISSTPAEEQINVIHAGAIAATDIEVRAFFITSIFRIRNFMPDGEDPQLSDSHRQAWATLIDDSRPLDPKSHAANWIEYPVNLGQLAAIAAEFSIDPNAFHDMSEMAGILKSTVPDLAMARIKARLANETLPALPAPENITPERLQEIITAAGGKSPAEIPAYLDALTPDERAAWFLWMQDTGDITPPESVRQLAMTITEESTASESGLQPTPGLLDLKSGLQFHEDTIATYIDTLAKNAATHSLSFGIIQPSDFPPGLKSWTLRATIPDPNADNEDDEDNVFDELDFSPIQIFHEIIEYFGYDNAPENSEALIGIFYYNTETHDDTTFLWWVIDGKPTPFTINDDGEVSPEIEVTLPEILATARESLNPFMLRIQVITRADALRVFEE